MSCIMVDVESDGPIPGDYSMISFGALVVEPSLTKTFYAQLQPISDKWIPEALQISGFTREETLAFEEPQAVMEKFAVCIEAESSGRPFFIADNNGFDWQFINWYFYHFCGNNPLGHTSSNLGSLYKGLVKDTFVNFKHLRKTAPTHNALEDAKGNAEALLQLKQEFGLKISLK
ncbi:exonuclease domain-containing protein [Chamaesiphon sp. VAR_48_metabat_403]|uniref:exonuclease domain-containing protein n=1 Tax=Chamaesiphon sp. VAR_48_metabat_403 TaxID=2964700 RepID=UPI00286DDA70|nr:exonuclease domain-containing protein [Chamaesiphon sp. VAR_48_metabat_403]